MAEREDFFSTQKRQRVFHERPTAPLRVIPTSGYEAEHFDRRGLQGLQIFRHRWSAGRSHLDELVLHTISLDEDSRRYREGEPDTLTNDQRTRIIDRYGARMAEAIDLGIDPIALGGYVHEIIAYLKPKDDKQTS